MAQREEVADLLALLDHLEQLLERSALSELELEVGGTSVVLRTPAALAPIVTAVPESVAGEPLVKAAPLIDGPLEEHAAHAVVAPLTGVFYRSPSPGAEPYVREGGPVNDGQVIGLIEAMKLFNEIKSDVTGRVIRVGPADGDLVKARQTLIEVDPS